MYQPLISIIITILNGEKTISQCLNSIDNQSFFNYEVVIVDGGSTDHTVEIIKEHKLLNKTVHILPGLGLYAGLNAGIRLAKGKWLYFIGCDDELYSPDTLSEVANVIERSDGHTKVFVGNVQCIKQDNMLRAKFGSPYLMRYQVHHQGMFYDRNIFTDLVYNENRRIASDYELNLKLALQKISHQSMDIIICNFGGDGISENQAKRGFFEMQDVHKQLFDGSAREWIMNYNSLQYYVRLLRKRLNLVNLKVKFKRLIGVYK